MTVTVNTGQQQDPEELGYLSLCPPELFDGWMVHSAAIRRGLHTWLLPGEALLVGSSAESLGDLAFAHGVPSESRLSSVTLVQDKRIRRAVLEDTSIRIPKGATFSIGRGASGARRYAKELGYPVVVKPMVGDNTIETNAGISDRRELTAAIQYLETAPPFRPRHTAASYAFTAIQTPRDDGSQKTRDNYRYLVEKQVPGTYIRMLGIQGKLVSVIYSPGGAWSDVDGGRDITEELDPSFAKLFDRVYNAFPGLPVLTVDVVASRGHQVPVKKQRVPVVEVSERPWLSMQRTYAPETVEALGDAILAGSAEANGVRIEAADDGPVARKVRWEGVPHYKEFLDAVKTFADQNGLVGWARMQDHIGGVAECLLQGEASKIALLGELALAGQLGLDAVMSMESGRATPEKHDALVLL